MLLGGLFDNFPAIFEYLHACKSVWWSDCDAQVILERNGYRPQHQVDAWQMYGGVNVVKHLLVIQTVSTGLVATCGHFGK